MLTFSSISHSFLVLLLCVGFCFSSDFFLPLYTLGAFGRSKEQPTSHWGAEVEVSAGIYQRQRQLGKVIVPPSAC